MIKVLYEFGAWGRDKSWIETHDGKFFFIRLDEKDELIEQTEIKQNTLGADYPEPVLKMYHEDTKIIRQNKH